MIFQEKIELTPIGFVKTEAVGDEVKDKSRTSQIILNETLLPTLDGITELFAYFHYLLDEPDSKG